MVQGVDDVQPAVLQIIESEQTVQQPVEQPVQQPVEQPEQSTTRSGRVRRKSVVMKPLYKKQRGRGKSRQLQRTCARLKFSRQFYQPDFISVELKTSRYPKTSSFCQKPLDY